MGMKNNSRDRLMCETKCGVPKSGDAGRFLRCCVASVSSVRGRALRCTKRATCALLPVVEEPALTVQNACNIVFGWGWVVWSWSVWCALISSFVLTCRCAAHWIHSASVEQVTRSEEVCGDQGFDPPPTIHLCSARCLVLFS